MSRKTCYWMSVSILSLSLFSVGTSASASCKSCKESVAIPQTPLLVQGFYVGAFGGGGNLNNLQVYQRGTAFFSEISSIGPLAVDAGGHVHSNSTWFGGLHLGFAWKNRCWGFTPAVEFEGFYLRNSFNGSLDAPHTALPEHVFDVSYHMSSDVFLINSVFTFKTMACPEVNLYVGGGLGGAIIWTANADSQQVSPPELNVNHFGAKKSASTDAFAAQVKVGLSYDITCNISVFAEYRFLYLGPTRFDFGSTIATGHVPTSPWGMNVDSMKYNLGAVGIQFNA